MLITVSAFIYIGSGGVNAGIQLFDYTVSQQKTTRPCLSIIFRVCSKSRYFLLVRRIFECLGRTFMKYAENNMD